MKPSVPALGLLEAQHDNVSGLVRPASLSILWKLDSFSSTSKQVGLS